MEKIEYSLEKIVDVFDEMSELLKKHYQEISLNHDIDLNPNIYSYSKLENRGSFKLFTVRDGGELVGYAAFFLNYNLHYNQSLQAVQDVIYLSSEYRGSGVGSKLIGFCDKKLKAAGVQLVFHHVKVNKDFSKTLEKQDYKKVEFIYSKRLDIEG